VTKTKKRSKKDSKDIMSPMILGKLKVTQYFIKKMHLTMPFDIGINSTNRLRL